MSLTTTAVARSVDVSTARRALLLTAVITLFLLTLSVWNGAAAPPPTLAQHVVSPLRIHQALLVLATAAFAALLLLAIAAMITRSGRMLHRLDVAVLALGLVLLLSQYVLAHAVNDEGALTAQAAWSLLHGEAVYGHPWPQLFPAVPLTKTMAGGGDYTYGYPPLAVLATAAVTAVIGHVTIAATLVTFTAVLAGVIASWFAAPALWRPLVVIALVASDLLLPFGRGGSPAAIAIALLVPVLLHFHRTGAGGRLGASGVGRAICLGAACATHQLVWFLVPFLAVGLLSLRSPEIGARRALLLLIRFGAVAAAVWVLIDLPFAIAQPRKWLGGILLPLRQHAILHGQGVLDVPYLLTHGSGALDLLNDASTLFLLGALGALLLFPHRFGPALTVLPWLAFFFATRGGFNYYVLFVPLWVAVAATVPVDAFNAAWRPRFVDRLRTRGKAAIVVALAVPALLCASIAVLTPPPLALRITALQTVAGHSARIAEVRIQAVNRSGQAIEPHFTLRQGVGASAWWRQRSGPRTLAPGASGSYVLTPVADSITARLPGNSFIAVSDRPMTISSVRIPVPADLAPGAPPAPSARVSR